MEISMNLSAVEQKKNNKKSIDPRLVTILLIIFMQELAAWMVLTTIPIFAQRDFGLSGQMITLIFAGFHIGRLFTSPMIGRFSDRMGRIPILVFSQIGTVITFILMATAPVGWLLLFARFFDGATGDNVILTQIYVTDLFPKEKRTEALSTFWIAKGAGVFVGPILAGVMLLWFEPNQVILTAAIMTALIVMITIVGLKETRPAEQKTKNHIDQNIDKTLSFRYILNHRTLLSLLFVAIALKFVFSVAHSTISLWGMAIPFAQMPPEHANIGVGLLLSIFGLGQMCVQLFALRPLLRHFGDKQTLLIGCIARTIGLLLFATVTTPFTAYGASLLFALGLGASRPPITSLITKTVDENIRGQIMGVFNSADAIGAIIGMLLAGVLVSIEPTLQFWVCAGVATAAIGVTLMLPNKENKERSRIVKATRLWKGSGKMLIADLTQLQAENTNLQTRVALLQTQSDENDRANKRRLHNTINALSYANANLYDDYNALQKQLRDKEQNLAQLQNTMAHIREQLTPYSMTPT